MLFFIIFAISGRYFFIHLSKTFENIDSECFSCDKLSRITINKLYVALTRTKGNLYIIKQSDFKKVETKYLNSLENI